MSVNYYLACMKCKTAVHPGKALRRQYRGVDRKTLGFASMPYRDEDTDVMSPGLFDDIECIGHFLMLHRGHELKVFPDTVDGHAGHKGFPHTFPMDDDDENEEYNRLVFLAQDIGEVDPVRQAEELSDEVIAKLREF